MCIIVDTNTFGPVFDSNNEKHAEFKPVLDWVLHGKGKFVIGGSKYMAELKKAKKFLKVFGVLNVSLYKYYFCNILIIKQLSLLKFYLLKICSSLFISARPDNNRAYRI